MLEFTSWYIVISITGWSVFPLVFRLTPALADHGYAFSRALGLLLWGYAFWLLASLGILHNTPGGVIFCLAILLGLSAWSLWKTGTDEIKAWMISRKKMILISELLFLVAFAGWAFVRAATPDASGTEKPMELAFINAILHSPSFPPHDPWLSGYAISYYYFGYVITAMLAMLSGTSAGVAFNLSGALVFGLSALGSYGLVYDVLQAINRSRQPTGNQPPIPAVRSALLGPLFLLLVSNLEGFLHSLHTRGFLWAQDSSGAWVSKFWQWLDINDLKIAPAEPFSWVPTRFWWWWRASRVIQDYDLANQPKEIINEFPFFSFLLADLHPHVLSLPFVFLAMALALNLYLGGATGSTPWFHFRVGLRQLTWISLLAFPGGIGLLVYGLLHISLTLAFLGVVLMILSGFFQVYRRQNPTAFQSEQAGPSGFTIGTELHVHPAYLLLLALVLGGLGFLNTWDLPAQMVLVCLAYVLPSSLDKRKKPITILKELTWFGLVLSIASLLLYALFYMGFASQAGGILPNLIYPTRGAQLWVMFAPLFIPMALYLVILAKKNKLRDTLRSGAVISAGLFLALWGFSFLLAYLITTIPQIGQFYLSSLGAPDKATLFQAAVLRRLASPGGWLTLFGFSILTLGLLYNSLSSRQALVSDSAEAEPLSPEGNSAHRFIQYLILLGTLLVIAPEFVYLRDQFGWRMNTIFKFYYQAWLLWSIAAASATAYMASRLSGARGKLFRAGMSLVLLMGLVYPVFALWNKTNGFNPGQWTLDGTAFYRQQAPDEMAAIDWLSQAPPGIVAEAVPPGGGSYTQYGRVSMFSGYPSVLGWVGHESQWRGGGEAMGSRQADLERLYCSRDWAEAQSILEKYNIRYVFLGNLERATYQAGSGSCGSGIVEAKFFNNLATAFRNGQTIIFEYTGHSADPQ